MPAASATFTQQDRFIGAAAPLADIGRGDRVNVEGSLGSSGTMTDTLVAAQTATTPQVDAGTVQYTDQLTETIIPPGPSTAPQIVTENSLNDAAFVNAEVDTTP
jgi:hypothetical protein